MNWQKCSQISILPFHRLSRELARSETEGASTVLRILSIFWGSFQITTMRKSLLCDGSMSSQCKCWLMLIQGEGNQKHHRKQLLSCTPPSVTYIKLGPLRGMANGSEGYLNNCRFQDISRHSHPSWATVYLKWCLLHLSMIHFLVRESTKVR